MVIINNKRSKNQSRKKLKCGYTFLLTFLFVSLGTLVVSINLSIAAPPQPPYEEPRAKPTSEQKSMSKQEQYHVVFSTSCHVKQDWQSYLFFFQAMVQKQEGTVTRIVSGCTPQQEAEMTEVFNEKIAIMNDNFKLHFTPEFGKVPGKNWQQTKYWNKPFGMKHWLENNFGYKYEGDISTPYDDDIVILVDPDMLMQRPFVNDFSGFPNSIWRTHFQNHPDEIYHKVSHGHPMAQDYSFASAWLTSGNIKANLVNIVGPDSPVLRTSKQEAKTFFPAGPPYILTARDFYRVAYHWSIFLPRIFDYFDGFMAEMYGYCMASAHLGLKHQMASGFMISNVKMSGGEGWSFLKDVEEDACKTSKYSETVPHVIHFCQRYSIGDYFLSKYKLPTDFLSCDFPLLELPPEDIAATATYSHYGDGSYFQWDDGVSHPEQKYRHTFMVCSLMSGLNQAATFYKDHHCPNGANYNQTWNTFKELD